MFHALLVSGPKRWLLYTQAKRVASLPGAPHWQSIARPHHCLQPGCSDRGWPYSDSFWEEFEGREADEVGGKHTHTPHIRTQANVGTPTPLLLPYSASSFSLSTCKVLATLNLTLATLSVDIAITAGRMDLPTVSESIASAITCTVDG